MERESDPVCSSKEQKLGFDSPYSPRSMQVLYLDSIVEKLRYEYGNLDMEIQNFKQ